MKSLEQYLNAPSLAREPKALREVHAIRLHIAEETKGMSLREFNEYVHRGADAFNSK